MTASEAGTDARRSPLRVLHVTPSFWPALRFGGPVESTLQLCRSLAAAGCEVTVLTTDSDGPGARLVVRTDAEVEMDGMRVRYCRKLMRNSVSPELISRLGSYVRGCEVIHLTAVYNFPTLPTLALCRRLRKPLIWSPRGALQEWPGRRRARAKRLWNRCCLRLAPPHTIVHATAAPEADAIRRALPGLTVSVIPNGVTIPDQVLPRVTSAERLNLLFIGRLDPKKGIENLLEACAMLKRRGAPGFALTIAGGGPESYRRALADLIQRLELGGEVRMIGEVEGKEKEAAFAAAAVVVVPSFVENFAMVVAEALARERPVIASRGTPWAELDEVGCGLWVDNAPAVLCEALCRISTMPLAEMGERGRRWMIERFGWAAIAREMLDCYAQAVAAARGIARAYQPGR